MKFGTIVTVERGSSSIPKGQPGCKRFILGTLVGARRYGRFVKLLQDDPLDSVPEVGWTKKGQIGCWSDSCVKPAKGATLVDKWWPEKPGRIIAHTKTILTIQWNDGVVTKYDKAHMKFITVTKAS